MQYLLPTLSLEKEYLVLKYKTVKMDLPEYHDLI